MASSPKDSSLLARIIHILIVTGWVLLPLSHFKWLPELGTTRPLSALPFGLAFAGLLLAQLNRGAEPLSPRRAWGLLRLRLRDDPAWRILRSGGRR
jgi:hypothetical protein